MIRFVPILPTKAFNPFGFRNEIVKQVADRVDFIKQDFEATTATWDTRVVFQRTYNIAHDEISGGVHTSNQVYCWVVLGTKKDYPIVPRNAKLLRFQNQYQAKTSKFVIGSQSGGKFGLWAERLSVVHPGIEAREFHITIATRHKRHFVNSIRLAMNEGVRRSGHGL